MAKSPTSSKVVSAGAVSAGSTNGPSGAVAPLSFLDAAEQILLASGDTTPLHYAEITKRAVQQGLVTTNGLTPEATLRGAVQREIEQAIKQGKTPRFVRHGNGLIGLFAWQPKGLDHQIKVHNDEVRAALQQKIKQMPPTEFEALIAGLLAAMDFQDPVVTQKTNDGGIDVTATLVVGNVIAIQMAVQVKRWQNNVQAPIVAALRGSLGVHDHGLIVTTSDFSQGARQQAQRQNAVPIALMNGNQLVDLLVEHEIGVTRRHQDLLQLGP
ncbi:MAG: restriction endonuclease [Chloroflexota bacterium]